MENRTDTAKYFADLTDSIIAGTPAPAEPAGLAAEAVTAQNAAPAAKPRKKKSKALLWLIPLILVVLLAGGAVGGFFAVANTANDLFTAGKYEQAKEYYEYIRFLPDYDELAKSCDYRIAGKLMEEGSYVEARETFLSVSDYQNSAELADEAHYLYGCELKSEKEYEDAIEVFESLGDYKDSDELRVDCVMAMVIDHYRAGRYKECIELAETCPDSREDAAIYMVLSNMRLLDMEGTDLENIRLIYDVLSESQFHNVDTREALEHPFFFSLRLFDTDWVFGDYYLHLDSESNSIDYNFPWATPDGDDIWYVNDDTALYFFITDAEGNDHLWFKVLDFVVYFVEHPQAAYIFDAESNMYTFTNPDYDPYA